MVSAYVAGMSTLSLPTSKFVCGLTVNDANDLGAGSDEALGSHAYLLLMWCPAMTAIYGSGKQGEVPRKEKLGGIIIKQLDPEELPIEWVTK